MRLSHSVRIAGNLRITNTDTHSNKKQKYYISE